MDTIGKQSAIFSDGTYMKENEFNRSVVRKIDMQLEKYGNIDVLFLNTEKRDISLDDRVKMANDYYSKNKSLYTKIDLISVHANALNGIWGNQNGTSTHYYPTNEVDKNFAAVINKHLTTKIGLTNRGNIGSNFQIIRDPFMTACLCECAFMDNLAEAKLLLTDEFREACSEDIVNGLLNYLGIVKKKVKKVSKVEYNVTKNGTHMLIGNVKDLKVKETNKSNRIMVEPNSINLSFFWNLTNGKKYSTSILYTEGITHQYYANHLPYPQSCFIVYKDNTIDMKRLHNLSEIDLSKVRLVIGGVGLINKLDSTFKYDLSGEGFIGSQSGVARKTRKTMIVYNKKEDKIYLVCRDNIYHKSSLQYDLIDLAGDIGDVGIAVDGGGSSFQFANGKNVFVGDGRVIYNIAYF